jgi:hypothetical protein
VGLSAQEATNIGPTYVRSVAHGRLYEPEGLYNVLKDKGVVEKAETDGLSAKSRSAISDEMFMYLAEGEDDVAKTRAASIASRYRAQIGKGYGLCRLLRTGTEFRQDFGFRFGIEQRDAGTSARPSLRRTECPKMTERRCHGAGDQAAQGA